ncbi:hypothetical protein D7D52_34965 [Nocardia yunnanensis]|uniref:Uncharacterized protein n=1 Tax=Nocardia yunnanensis TaxID=2382165 RepID=A0A386ZLY2_9NOCA|nr:hypothetical protein [Nocardia yunnanensis]AYF78174.1 hypothetical protein D7D52_34965 [Nocardia yunnanensis]
MHEHDGFGGLLAGLAGGGVDVVLLGQLVGAAFEECPSCQEALLTLVAEDAPTTAQLVELACVAVRETLRGYLPADLVDTDETDSPVPIGFRRLARASLDSDTATVNALCAGLAATERHAAARTATALFVGEMRAAGRG